MSNEAQELADELVCWANESDPMWSGRYRVRRAAAMLLSQAERIAKLESGLEDARDALYAAYAVMNPGPAETDALVAHHLADECLHPRSALEQP